MTGRDRELEADLAIERAARQLICTQCGRSHKDCEYLHWAVSCTEFRLETESEAAARYEAECESEDVRDYLNNERLRRP